MMASPEQSYESLLQAFVDVLQFFRVAVDAERQRADAAWQESDARFRQVFDRAFEGMILHDGGTILAVNPAYATLSGYDQADVVGRPALELLAPASRGHIVSHVLSGSDAPCVGHGVCKGGSTFRAELRSAPIPYQGRRVWVTSIRALAEPSQTEEIRPSLHIHAVEGHVPERTAAWIPGQATVPGEWIETPRLDPHLLQLQKLESIGRLAGGIAHELNNLLTVMLGFTTLAIQGLPAEHAVSPHLQEIHQAEHRAAELVEQLLAFARQQRVMPRLLDLNALLRTLDPMLRRLLQEDIQVVSHLAPTLGRVRMDPGQLEHVVVNLAANARDAMPTGGTLTLETANVTVDPQAARPHVGLRPGAYVTLTVRDTGCGMTEEVKAHLFEPFFTTKEVGQGTGLGLAACYGIVKQNEGYIAVESAVDHGTTVTIYWPRVEESASPSAPVPSAETRAADRETILLVEDEPAVHLAAHVLRAQGYTVLEAATGTEALRVMQTQQGSPIALLVTDVVMPQMGGKALVSRLHAEQPDLNVLFISGYSPDELLQHGIREAGLPLLQKPFTPETLVRMVREVLETPRSHDERVGGESASPG